MGLKLRIKFGLVKLLRTVTIKGKSIQSFLVEERILLKARISLDVYGEKAQVKDLAGSMFLFQGRLWSKEWMIRSKEKHYN